MGRLARVVVPGYSHHITQRGNRRQQTFFSDEDYQSYIDLMAECCNHFNVEIWSYGKFLPTDNAFENCRGHILVVGAGTGVHAFELEKRGYEVTAIDICPQAVQIMKERGIKDAIEQDFLQFEDERFDTLFVFGHNIGMCETLKGQTAIITRL